MKLDLTSIKKLIGNSNEVLIYGFLDCKYQKVHTAFDNMHYKVDNRSLFKTIPYDNGVVLGNFFKAILTSLAIENYKRSRVNKPFIYLIFCVAYEDGNSLKFVDIKRVATSHSTRAPESSITDQELRRCYKLYSETTPEIKKIIEKTFKFVKVKKIDKDRNYTLEELKPFWEEENWDALWQERKNNTSSLATKKIYPWRKVLTKKINFINNSSVLFKQSITNTSSELSTDIASNFDNNSRKKIAS